MGGLRIAPGVFLVSDGLYLDCVCGAFRSNSLQELQGHGHGMHGAAPDSTICSMHWLMPHFMAKILCLGHLLSPIILHIKLP